MATLLKLLAVVFVVLIDLFVSFYGTTLSYLYAVDLAPIAF